MRLDAGDFPCAIPEFCARFATNELGTSNPNSKPSSPTNDARPEVGGGAGLDHMSRELLLSIEHILKKHMNGDAPRSPSPHLHTEPSMVSQLTEYGEAEGGHFNRPHSSSMDSGAASIHRQHPGSPHKTGALRNVNIGLGDLFTAKPVEAPRQQQQQQSPQHHFTSGSPSKKQHGEQRAVNVAPLYTIEDASEQSDRGRVSPSRQAAAKPQQQQQVSADEPAPSGASVVTSASKAQKSVPKIGGVKVRHDSAASGNAQLELEIRTAEAEYRAMMTSLLSVVDLKVSVFHVVWYSDHFLLFLSDQHQERTESMEHRI